MNNKSGFKRSAGVLMPVSALPSPYGIGCFSRDAEMFAEMAADMGFSWWQILPITILGAGNSPYSGYSTHAGNYLFINPALLCMEGLITADEAEEAKYRGQPYKVDYDFARENMTRVLRLAFGRINDEVAERIAEFEKKESYWLDDYALFMALSDSYGSDWTKWEKALAFREPAALEAARKEHKDGIAYYIFEQYEFYRQWHFVKEKINARGIRIIGDLPFYVATQSVDVWTHASEFMLGKDGRPSAVAGVPPDAFAERGQVWGNCLYDFAAMKKNGYKWWRERITHCLEMYDALRLDHFRAFHNFFSIPAEDTDTAVNGHWEYGPGQELIDLIRSDNPGALFIAEDLGLIDDECRAFIDGTGIPTMRVFQFAFDGTQSVHLPYFYDRTNVAYSGTHDNNTLLGWLYEMNPDARDFALKYCGFTGPGWGSGGPQCASTKAILRTISASSAVLAVFPVQDMLGYGADTRMNIPGVAEGNWEYRLPYELMMTVDRDFFLDINNTYGRLGGSRT